jgi:hypothetical protein
VLPPLNDSFPGWVYLKRDKAVRFFSRTPKAKSAFLEKLLDLFLLFEDEVEDNVEDEDEEEPVVTRAAAAAAAAADATARW